MMLGQNDVKENRSGPFIIDRDKQWPPAWVQQGSNPNAILFLRLSLHIYLIPPTNPRVACVRTGVSTVSLMLGATSGTSLFGQQQSAFVTAFRKAAQHRFGNITGNELDE